MKKKMILILAGTACICLTGCGKQAKELAESYDGNRSHSVEISYGIENAVSIEVKTDVDEGNAHGTMAVAGTVPKSAEFYRDGNMSYVYDADNEYWTASEDSTITDLAFLFTGLEPDSFPDEKVKYDRKAGAYVVKQSFDDFMETGEYMEMAALFGEMGIAAGGGSDEEYVTYMFDKDGSLMSVTADSPVSINVKFIFREQDITVPDGVKESALPADISMDFTDVYEEISESSSGNSSAGHTSSGNTSSGKGVDPGFVINYEGNTDPGMTVSGSGYESVDPGMVMDSDDVTDNKSGTKMPESSHSSDDGDHSGTDSGTGYGTYEDNPLTDQGNEWQAAFGDTGWEFTTDDYTENHMEAKNSQYPGAVFTVYGADENKNTSAYDIIKYGFCDYNIDCHDAQAYPPFAWNGVTFGASADEIKKVWGEPAVTYEGNEDTAYRYLMDGTEIIFYVNSNGLCQVSFSR